MAAEFPSLTYDVTIKVEHLLRHAALLPVLRDTGCLFVTTAAESFDDEVLARLDKGHTRADFERVVAACRAIDLPLAPTFIPFTPWTTIDTYRDLLDGIAALDLVGSVPPIQLTLRLLICQGSLLLALDDVRALVQPFDPRKLVFPWAHPDPAVDALQRRATELVRRYAQAPRGEVFDCLRRLADADVATLPAIAREPAPRCRTDIPYLNEPWYC
jgi:hypothetical protein